MYTKSRFLFLKNLSLLLFLPPSLPPSFLRVLDKCQVEVEASLTPSSCLSSSLAGKADFIVLLQLGLHLSSRQNRRHTSPRTVLLLLLLLLPLLLLLLPLPLSSLSPSSAPLSPSSAPSVLSAILLGSVLLFLDRLYYKFPPSAPFI